MWNLLTLALEITLKHGPLKWDQRRGVMSPKMTPQGQGGQGRAVGSPLPSSPRRGDPKRGAGPGTPLDNLKLPRFSLEPAAAVVEPQQDTAVDEEGIEDEAELSLLADAAPMLRFFCFVTYG